MASTDNVQTAHVVHSLEDNKISLLGFLLILGVTLVLGVGVGYAANQFRSSGASSLLKAGSTKKTEGVVDKKKFPDSAEGVLREGGLDGEGNFHLERPGGESQNVYLTSSVVDLSNYVGQRVKVGGQTFAGQKAGWLMDVGYVEVK